MIQPETWKAIEGHAAKIWAAAGPLAGVFVGAWLARSWDKRKWINDNRKEEYKELVTALTTAAMSLIEHHQGNRNLVSQKEAAVTKELYMRSLLIIQDRIFIATDITKLSIFDRWGEAMKELDKTSDFRKFEDAFGAMKDELIRAATKY